MSYRDANAYEAGLLTAAVRNQDSFEVAHLICDEYDNVMWGAVTKQMTEIEQNFVNESLADVTRRRDVEREYESWGWE